MRNANEELVIEEYYVSKPIRDAFYKMNPKTFINIFNTWYGCDGIFLRKDFNKIMANESMTIQDLEESPFSKCSIAKAKYFRKNIFGGVYWSDDVIDLLESEELSDIIMDLIKCKWICNNKTINQLLKTSQMEYFEYLQKNNYRKVLRNTIFNRIYEVLELMPKNELDIILNDIKEKLKYKLFYDRVYLDDASEYIINTKSDYNNERIKNYLIIYESELMSLNELQKIYEGTLS